MKSKKTQHNGLADKVEKAHLNEKRRKQIEGAATFGLILVALGLAAPFTNLMNYDYVKVFKWIYGAGALIFVIARIMGANDPGDSSRVRRLRRIECWAGIALCIGTFFWFYNEGRYGQFLQHNGGVLTCLRETIVFSLVGALIQVMASWMIYYRQKKELKDR